MGDIFWEEFFWRNFLGGFFWEEFFERIFLGEIFWEEFFGRNSLFTMLKSAKLLQTGLFVKILVFVIFCLKARKEGRTNSKSLEVQLQAHPT